MLKNFLTAALLFTFGLSAFAETTNTISSTLIELAPLTVEQQETFFSKHMGCRAIIYQRDSDEVILGVASQGKKYLFKINDELIDNIGRYDRKQNSVFLSNLELGSSSFYDLQVTPNSKTSSCKEMGSKQSCKKTQATLYITKDTNVVMAEYKTEIEVDVKDYCGMRYGDRLFLPQNLLFTGLEKLTAH